MLRRGTTKAESGRRVPLLNALSLLPLFSLFPFHVFNHQLLCSFRVSKNPTFWSPPPFLYTHNPFSSFFVYCQFNIQSHFFGSATSIAWATWVILRLGFLVIIRSKFLGFGALGLFWEMKRVFCEQNWKLMCVVVEITSIASKSDCFCKQLPKGVS